MQFITYTATYREVVAQWSDSQARDTKVASSILWLEGIVGGGRCTALSPPSIPRLRCS